MRMPAPDVTTALEDVVFIVFVVAVVVVVVVVVVIVLVVVAVAFKEGFGCRE